MTKVVGLVNNKKRIAIGVIIFLVGIIFPVGFLLGFIIDKVAFPMMFIWLGCLQLYNSFILSSVNKKLKLISIIFGISFILFAFIIVIPRYYF